MKISTNRQELKALNACASGYRIFIEAHGDNDATLSQCLESNGWDDVWWLIEKTYSQFSEEQKHDLRFLACGYAKINIEKIKPYCSEDDYKVINDYLDNPIESARSAAESAAGLAARSAAQSAQSAAWSAVSSAWATAWPAQSVAWATARSAAESSAEKDKLKALFVKWENQQ